MNRNLTSLMYLLSFSVTCCLNENALFMLEVHSFFLRSVQNVFTLIRKRTYGATIIDHVPSLALSFVSLLTDCLQVSMLPVDGHAEQKEDDDGFAAVDSAASDVSAGYGILILSSSVIPDSADGCFWLFLRIMAFLLSLSYLWYMYWSM